MVTLKPWPIQWAAAETPVRPAPMMAMCWGRSLAFGRGGLGENKAMTIVW